MVHDGNMSAKFGDPFSSEANRRRFLGLNTNMTDKTIARMQAEQGNVVMGVEQLTDTVYACDGLVTDRTNQIMELNSGDYPSIIIFSTKYHLLAHIHAGRRTLDAGIIAQAILKLQLRCPRLTFYPQEFQAIITPGICPQCYHFPGDYYEEHLKAKWPNVEPNAAGRFPIDLRGRIQRELQAFGMTKIMTWGGCNVCQMAMFSHLRGQTDRTRYGRHLVAAWLEE